MKFTSEHLIRVISLTSIGVIIYSTMISTGHMDGVPDIVAKEWVKASINEISDYSSIMVTLLINCYVVYICVSVVAYLMACFYKKLSILFLFLSYGVLFWGVFQVPWHYETRLDSIGGGIFWLMQGVLITLLIDRSFTNTNKA